MELVEILGYVVIPLIICVAGAIIAVERDARKKAEKELEGLEKSLSQAKSNDARIIYQAYFGRKYKN